ncbi:MAG: hypothetical protein NVS1B14_09700 [Vulcanimicrobiaceae bacterium]
MTLTNVSLDPHGYDAFYKLLWRKPLSGAFYGYKVLTKGDPQAGVIYVERSCCGKQEIIIASVTTFPPGTTMVHTEHPLGIGGLHIGLTGRQIIRRFGKAPLRAGQLRYELLHRPGTDRSSGCGTRYVFTLQSNRVVAMDFDNEC